jgi:hypothetical protein
MVEPRVLEPTGGFMRLRNAFVVEWDIRAA